MLRRYILPPEEIQRVIDMPGPLHDLQVDPEKMREMRVAVVEVDGEIVAYWVAWYALHLEPLWIAPEHRKTLSVVKGIVAQMQEVTEASGEPSAFCTIEAENLPVVSDYAERLGFLEAPGKLYYLVLPQPAQVGGGK